MEKGFEVSMVGVSVFSSITEMTSEGRSLKEGEVSYLLEELRLGDSSLVTNPLVEP